MKTPPRHHKLSVSLPADSARFIERYRRTHALKTRSEVIARALNALRERELESAYRASARELREDAAAWDATAADGLTDETW